MSKSTPTDVVLERTGSHHFSDDPGRGPKEEVYGYFRATWRGQPVMVTMSADRYTYSGGEMSDWRVYAQDARYFDPERNGGRGDDVTETARWRLSDACRPVMIGWLASDAYAGSLACAVRNMIVREAEGRWGDTAHRLLAEHGDKLTEAQRDAIGTALEHRNAYRDALKAAGDA